MKSRVFPLVKKETLHILRDARSLYLALGVPILLLVLFGFAITFDVENISVSVVDLDHSSLSRELISRLTSAPQFDLHSVLNGYTGVDRLMLEGKVKVVLGIPASYSKKLSRGEDVKIQLLVDGSDNNTALVSMAYLSGLLQKFSADLMQDNIDRQGPSSGMKIPPVELKARIWYNPDLRSASFIVPGLIAVVMMIVSAMMTSLTIAREWERGTMEQLMATPARPREIILGKITPYYFLGLLQTSMVIVVGRFLFGVPLKGNLFFLFCMISVFLACGLGIGLLISVVTRSQQLAFMLSILFTMLPSFLLSGFVFPISSMPPIIQFFTYLVPARYFLVILRGIFLKANGLEVLWPQAAALVIFALVIILACARKMKLRLE